MTSRSNAEVLDILFAVALGEGFLTAMYDYKPMLVSGEVFTFGEPGQAFARILLTFLLIILSWLHFRRGTLAADDYPRGEFIVDVLVTMSYMTLFLFVDTPTLYYGMLAVVWFFYVTARALSPLQSMVYTLFGSAFIAVFLLVAWFSAVSTGAGAEWARIVLATVLVIAYRPMDHWVAARLFGNRS